ncbi:MAG: response regulator [Melioribacteraceae bacterium]|jgi:CheY-like chemotaxis protein|nr:response regulator [Melioribacteraceae bacterium]
MIRIMVVDDELDVEPLFNQKFRKEIREGLLHFHFTFSAEDALEYLKSATAADLVLILSDINMPGLSGIELLRILKEQYAYLKVFMVTAYDDKEKYEQSMKYGAEEYLTKPIDFEKLKTEILSLKKRD